MTTEAAATTSAPEPGGGRPERAAAAISEQLFARHQRMVVGLCRALLRDPTEAEDAAQQAFLSAHRSLLNGAEPREPAAWLATIARNECWSRISGRMREPLSTDATDEIAGTDDPVAAAIRRADLAALWTAIRALPRSQRNALLLREFGGLSYGELAAALAVTEPAVESLLVRARARLRTQLETVYASLAPLVRFFVSGGAPAIATKAVALGLGAAAVTGGAVVAPTMLERHTRHEAPVQAQPRHVAPVAVVMPLAMAAPLPVVHTVAAVAPRARNEGDGARRDAVSARNESGDTHEGETTKTTSERTTTEEERSGSDSGGSTGSVVGGGSSGGSESRDGSSGDGEHGSTQPATTTTATTTTTTTTTTTDTAAVTTVPVPVVTVPQAGGDG